MYAAIADVDWATFARVFESTRRRPLIAEVVTEGESEGEIEGKIDGEVDRGTMAAEPAPRDGERSAFALRLGQLSPEDQVAALRELVGRELAQTLRTDAPVTATPERPFRELGLDSLTAVELRNRLVRATGKALPVTLMFDHPNLNALVAYLQAQLAGDGRPSIFEALDHLQARLEATVGQLPGDHADRALVRERLAALAAMLGAPSAAGRAGDDADLIAASDEEVFALIDRELEG